MKSVDQQSAFASPEQLPARIRSDKMPQSVRSTAPNLLFGNLSDLDRAFEALLTKKQIADRLELSQSFINQLMSEEGLPHFRIGRAVRSAGSRGLAPKKESTMTKMFNTKIHQGKDRIYSAIPRWPRVSRLWVWDREKQYQSPTNGNVYYAARYETSPLSGRKRVYESFPTLEGARTWQSGISEIVAPTVTMEVTDGSLFSEV